MKYKYKRNRRKIAGHRPKEPLDTVNRLNHQEEDREVIKRRRQGRESANSI